MASQRVGHRLPTEQQQQEQIVFLRGYLSKENNLAELWLVLHFIFRFKKKRNRKQLPPKWLVSQRWGVSCWGAFRLALLWSSQELSFGPFRGHQGVSLWDWTLLSGSDLEQVSQTAPHPWTQYALGMAPKLRIRFYIFKWSEKETSRRILFHGTWKLYGIHISVSRSEVLNFINKKFCRHLFSLLLYKYLHNLPSFASQPTKPKIYHLALHTVFFLSFFWPTFDIEQGFSVYFVTSKFFH